MMFTFWTQAADKETPPPTESVKEWQAVFPEFKVFGDDDVIEILKNMSDIHVDMYNRIVLPACRSDLARLLLAHHHGGMYVDIHTQPANMTTLAHIFSLLAEYELVLCDNVKGWQDKNDMRIANGALWCRKNGDIISIILKRVLKKLLDHMKKEDDTDEYVPYNIAVLSGSWAILETVYDTRFDRPLPFRDEAKGKVFRYPYLTNEKSTPFHFYRHYGYREPNQHWSERQKTQRLFSK